jgi:hypothetical protein
MRVIPASPRDASEIARTVEVLFANEPASGVIVLPNPITNLHRLSLSCFRGRLDFIRNRSGRSISPSGRICRYGDPCPPFLILFAEKHFIFIRLPLFPPAALKKMPARCTARDAWADTTTPHGRLMLTVLGGLAEFERELIIARTDDGRKRAQARGVRFGRACGPDDASTPGSAPAACPRRGAGGNSAVVHCLAGHNLPAAGVTSRLRDVTELGAAARAAIQLRKASSTPKAVASDPSPTAREKRLDQWRQMGRHALLVEPHCRPCFARGIWRLVN